MYCILHTPPLSQLSPLLSRRAVLFRFASLVLLSPYPRARAHDDCHTRATHVSHTRLLSELVLVQADALVGGRELELVLAADNEATVLGDLCGHFLVLVHHERVLVGHLLPPVLNGKIK